MGRLITALACGPRGLRGAGGALGLLAILVVASLAALPAQAEKLRIGVYGEDPPLSFIDDNGEVAGFDIDFARALCRQARQDCDLIQADWDELLPGLEQRRFDAVVASVSITDERRKIVAFTRPYYDSPARFVARKGRFQNLDPAHLSGVRIGLRRGTTFDRYATDNLAQDNEIYHYSAQPDALVDLMLGRTDLVLGDHIALEENFLSTEAGGGFELVGPPLADPRWFGDGLGVAVVDGDRDLLETLDSAVGELHRSGIFDLIRRRWFDYPIRGLSERLRDRPTDSAEAGEEAGSADEP